jgi:hypothetical protein
VQWQNKGKKDELNVLARPDGTTAASRIATSENIEENIVGAGQRERKMVYRSPARDKAHQ